MISREHRFHGHNSLQYVYKRGKMVRTGALSLKYTPNARRNDYRLAVVVSRKVSKFAVVRNRIRRRIYEVVRLQSADFNTVHDITILVYDEKLAILPANQLANEIHKLLKKAAILETSTPIRGIVDEKE